ncbi:MAG: Arm DNA-binding domain-containing protein [Pseudomonadota bacterium]
MPTLHKLTALEVRRAKGQRELSDGGGLILNVRDSGAESWTFVYRFEGRRPEVGLGSWPEVTQSDARAKAAEARKWLAETPKRDPRSEWQRKAKATRPAPKRPRFGDFALQFINERARGWKHPDNE